MSTAPDHTIPANQRYGRGKAIVYSPQSTDAHIIIDISLEKSFQGGLLKIAYSPKKRLQKTGSNLQPVPVSVIASAMIYSLAESSGSTGTAGISSSVSF